MNKCESCLGYEICDLNIENCKLYLTDDTISYDDLVNYADEYAKELFNQLANKIKEVFNMTESKDALADIFLVDDSGIFDTVEEDQEKQEEVEANASNEAEEKQSVSVEEPVEEDSELASANQQEAVEVEDIPAVEENYSPRKELDFVTYAQFYCNFYDFIGNMVAEGILPVDKAEKIEKAVKEIYG